MSQITLLNSMVSRDFHASLDEQAAWGIRVLDLKDYIYGKAITDLKDDEAHQAADQIIRRGMSVYCLSTEILNCDIEEGKEAICGRYTGMIERTVKVARILRPTVIRIIAARSRKRNEFSDSVAYVKQNHRWVIEKYRDIIDCFHSEGFQTTIENECRQCLLSRPDEIHSFFQEIDRSGRVFFTYDVQNLWQMGTFPSLDVYRDLAPLVGYFHVKGGQSEQTGGELKWKSSIEDASWPAAEMIRQVAKDGISQIICLNPSHGLPKPGYDYDGVVLNDLNFIRKTLNEILLNEKGGAIG